MKTETIFLTAGVLIAAALHTVLVGVVVPAAALILTLAGWNPGLVATSAPAPDPPAVLPMPPPPSAEIFTSRDVLNTSTVSVLRGMAQRLRIPRSIYKTAKKEYLVKLIIERTS